MARDGGRGRGSGRGRGRPRKKMGIPLNLQTTPSTTTTTATTSTPSLSASQGPPIHMIPAPRVRVLRCRHRLHNLHDLLYAPHEAHLGPRQTLMVMVTTRMSRPPSPATLVPYCDGTDMIGTEQITIVFKGCYKWYFPHFHLAPEEAINTWWDEAAKRLRELFHGIREKGYPSDWIPDDIFKQLKEYWASEEYLALKRTNKENRASSVMHEHL
ncbi:hypothetical protein PIB30_088036 [Stylosanthes scabra]|uniref:Uncharacterized protein n=1 Tax=Stylosanthes scabra TaxID=79078 RepID=A0ABU6YVH3_9FABA|nr:hypothetical protein [Stylosanthes scabra]